MGAFGSFCFRSDMLIIGSIVFWLTLNTCIFVKGTAQMTAIIALMCVCIQRFTWWASYKNWNIHTFSCGCWCIMSHLCSILSLTFSRKIWALYIGLKWLVYLMFVLSLPLPDMRSSAVKLNHYVIWWLGMKSVLMFGNIWQSFPLENNTDANVDSMQAWFVQWEKGTHNWTLCLKC